MEQYVLGIDQSTQGTKALLFDKQGAMLARADMSHKQYVTDEGWVSHDLDEIFDNTIKAVKAVVDKAGIDKSAIVTAGISNQRETAAIWDRKTGKPLNYAVVWQCSRSKNICHRIELEGGGGIIKEYTGIPLSPFFPASKMKWLLDNSTHDKDVCLGTIDSWLIFKLTGGFKTDYSNASRTQLFNINSLGWDEELCRIFGVPMDFLAEVVDSNAEYGETDFGGYLENKIPIQGVMGDSHAALFGQGCKSRGMIKATYGTGASIMMNTGEVPVISKSGVVTSLAWGIDGKINYVLEGNINYAGAVVTWLKDNLHIIDTPEETEALAEKANPADETYLVPAFTGLGAPYWKADALGALFGMKRFTGRNEIVRAGLECIGYQVNDIIEAMKTDGGIPVRDIRVDGGITNNKYLMNFQSDITGITVSVSDAEELSGIGAGYLAGIKAGVYPESVFDRIKYISYTPDMAEGLRRKKIEGWHRAVRSVMEY